MPRRVRHDNLVHFARRDLLPAANDDLLQAPRDRHVPIGVHRSLVPGAEPALDERLGVGRRVVLVPAHHARAADHDLPGGPGGTRVPRPSTPPTPGPPPGPTRPGLRGSGGSGFVVTSWQ